jgi:hypothetical protein
MAARTCLYSDPKNPEDGPRLYLSNLHGWVEDPQQAVEFVSLSAANRPHQVPVGYQPSQSILAEVVKVHPAILRARVLVPKLQGLFPDAVVTSVPPKQGLQQPWFFDVKMPPNKRSFVIEYRYQHHGYHIKVFGEVGVKASKEQDFIVSDELMLLQAITLSEPIDCNCVCHGPIPVITHCFGDVCCPEMNVPRTNADKEARS